MLLKKLKVLRLAKKIDRNHENNIKNRKKGIFLVNLLKEVV